MSACRLEDAPVYVSPKSRRTARSPAPGVLTGSHVRQDLWAPDLFGEFAGVCSPLRAPLPHGIPVVFVHQKFDFAQAGPTSSTRPWSQPIPCSTRRWDLKPMRPRATGLAKFVHHICWRYRGIATVVAMLVNCSAVTRWAQQKAKVHPALRSAPRSNGCLFIIPTARPDTDQEGTCGVIQMPRVTMVCAPLHRRRRALFGAQHTYL